MLLGAIAHPTARPATMGSNAIERAKRFTRGAWLSLMAACLAAFAVATLVKGPSKGLAFPVFACAVVFGVAGTRLIRSSMAVPTTIRIAYK